MDQLSKLVADPNSSLLKVEPNLNFGPFSNELVFSADNASLRKKVGRRQHWKISARSAHSGTKAGTSKA